jgi:hypothetical protein
MECVGLHNKPKAEVNPERLLMALKEKKTNYMFWQKQ